MNAVEAVRAKFTSDNSVPIDRAVVTKEEWDAIEKYIQQLVESGENLLTIVDALNGE